MVVCNSISRTTDGLIFRDTFDDETTGNDPSNWTINEGANTNIDIDDVTYYGASGKSMRIYDNGAEQAYASKSVGNQTSLVIEWYYYMDSETTPNLQMRVRDGGTSAVYLLDDGTNWEAYNNTTRTNLVTFNPDQWYHFRLTDFNFTNDTFDVYIDHTQRANNFTFYNSYNASDLDEILFASTNSGVLDHYVDEVKCFKSETITMNNLEDDQKFRIRKSGPTTVATSGAASGGSASIDLTSLSDRPPYYDIQVLDTDGSTVIYTDTTYQNNIWGGDIYSQEQIVHLDRNLSLNIEKTSYLDRNISTNIEKTLYFDRNISTNIILPAYFDRNLSLNVEQWDYEDRNISLHVTSPDIEDRNISVNVEKILFLDRNLSLNIEQILLLDRNLSLNVEQTDYEDRNFSLDIEGVGVELWENYNINDDDSSPIYGTLWKAQTYTTLSDWHTTTILKLKMYRVGSPGTLTVSIKATDGSGKPTGGDLASGSINANTLTASSLGEWVEINISDVTLDTDTKYAIVCRATSGNVSNLVRWKIDNSSPTYTGGSLAASSDSGSSWNLLTVADCMFEVYGMGAETGYNDRNLSLTVEKMAFLDRNFYLDVQPYEIDYLDRNASLNIEQTSFLDRNISLNVQIGVNTDYLDRNMLLTLRKTKFKDRNMSLNVIYPGYLDRNFSLDAEVLHDLLDRNLSLNVNQYGYDDRNFLLQVQTPFGDIEGKPMLGDYTFQNVRTIDLEFNRFVAERDIVDRNRNYRIDMGGEGAKVVIVGFFYTSTWETDRQELEALKDNDPAIFDWGIGGPNFNAVVYDLNFERDVMDPISGYQGVRYTVYLMEQN